MRRGSISKVNLTAFPASGWQFDGWKGDASGNANPLSVIVDGTKNIEANFSPIQRTLTINIIGNGTVQKNPDQPTYDDGTVVQLTATPGPGWAFVNWTGGLNSNANPANVTMNQDRTVANSQIISADASPAGQCTNRSPSFRRSTASSVRT